MLKKIVFAVFVCVNLHASAQTDSLAPYLNMSLEELLKLKVTTAGKQEQKISEIPASVLVVTRAEIEAYGYQSLKEILSNALGMYKIDDYKNVSFGVRGFFSNVYNRNIIFMINGVIQQQSYLEWNDLNLMNLQVESIERIEFVRGPVAIIYGNDAFFGAINIITSQEGAGVVSSATVAYGSDNSYRGNLQINSVGKNTSINFSAGYFHTDGRDFQFAKILDSVQRNDGVWIKDGTTKGYFRQTGKYVNLKMSHQGFYVNLSSDETFRNLIHFWKPIYGSDMNTKRNYIVRSSIGYRKDISSVFKLDFHVDAQNSYFTNGFANVVYKNPPIKYGSANSECQNTMVELITFVKPVKKIHVTAGLNYAITPRGYLDLDIPDLQYDRYSVNLHSPSVLYAAFAQVEYELNTKIHFIGGLRADKQNRYEYKNIKFESTVYKDTVYSYEYEKIEVVPLATFIYAINADNTLKIMYSKAISRPGIYENSYVNWQLHPLIVPQSIETAEIGYSSIPIRNLSISLNLFYNKLNDLIDRSMITDTSGRYVNQNNNTGKLETLGAELQVNYKPTPKILIDASFCCQKTTNLLFDVDAAYSPNILGYLKMIYNLKKDVVLAFNSYYVGKMESELVESPVGVGAGNGVSLKRIYKTTPAYFNLGANIRFDNQLGMKCYFGLHVDNLLNSDIYYAPTTVNVSYLPKGTYDSKMQLNVFFGFKL